VEGNIELYLDDSGSPLPDNFAESPRADGMDCFALGGILVEQINLPIILKGYKTFCQRWGINYPIHSNGIRTQTKKFVWLGKLDDKRKSEFFADIERMIESQPFVPARIQRPV
jgi:hypothetical protein